MFLLVFIGNGFKFHTQFRSALSRLAAAIEVSYNVPQCESHIKY